MAAAVVVVVAVVAVVAVVVDVVRYPLEPDSRVLLRPRRCV